MFCFIKRQITRFTLRSSHGPHAPIGMDAPKVMTVSLCVMIVTMFSSDTRAMKLKNITHHLKRVKWVMVRRLYFVALSFRKTSEKLSQQLGILDVCLMGCAREDSR